MQNFQFSPRNITVQAGDTVTWVNRDFMGHDTVSGQSGSPSGVWNSTSQFGRLMFNNESFSFTFNVAPGVYSYYCTPHWAAFNMTGSVTVTPRPNVPPTVSITSPQNGATFTEGAAIPITATAADSDGTVVRVEFLVNGSQAGVDAVAPYSFTLNNVAAGSYTLAARAVDNQGAQTTSAPVSITVSAPPPGPSILLHPQSQSVQPGGTVTFNVVVSGPEPIQFQWRHDGNAIPGATESALILSNVTEEDAGNYTVLVSNPNGAVESQPAVLEVTEAPNISPEISIITPQDGARLPGGGEVEFAVDAQDADGVIASVEFFVGTDLVGVAEAQPFRLRLDGLTAGTHVLFARATDDRGATTTSLPVTISLHDLPAIALVQPQSEERIPLGADVVVSAQVAGDAGVVRVEFLAAVFAGEFVRIGETVVEPHTIQWSPGIAADHLLRAEATDEFGRVAVSAPVSVRVFVAETNVPAVTVTSGPADFARVHSSPVFFAGTASDDIGVERVEFQINDGPFVMAEGTVSWSAEVFLAAGTNVIRFQSIDQAGNISTAVERAVVFVVLDVLTLQVEGAGTVRPNLEGRLLEIGQIFHMRAVPAAGHVFAGWEGGEALPQNWVRLAMASNLTLTARFVPNPFPAVAGTYVGLVFDTEVVAPESSGFFRLRVTRAGAVSGTLLLQGKRHALRGRLDASGHVKIPILRRGLRPIVVDLELDMESGANRVTGTVTEAEWTALLEGSRSPFHARRNPATAFHSDFLVRSEDGEVAGTGEVVLQRSGLARVRLRLDFLPGAVVRRLPVSAGGEFPVYVSLARGREVIIGWLELLPGQIGGELVRARAEEDGRTLSIQSIQHPTSNAQHPK